MKGEANNLCAATHFIRLVDGQLNPGAMQEAAEATSELQESGADLGKGSAYLVDSGTIVFKEDSIACGICKSKAYLFSTGTVFAPNCLVSGSCEVDWVKKYPDKYRDDKGALAVSQLLCGAREINCGARLRLSELDGNIVPTVISRRCYVDDRGDNWKTERDKSLREERCVRPQEGIQEFDGDQSDTEAARAELLQHLAGRLHLLVEFKEV